MGMKEIIEEKLFENQDTKYGDFQFMLTPGINRNDVVGVRIPILRKIAKSLMNCDELDDYLKSLPHKYYEENILESIILSNIKDFDKCLDITSTFLPYVDNWAVCDTLSPHIFKKHKNELYEKIKEWISSDEPFTIRFGVKMLMTFFLEDDFKDEHIKLILTITNEEYYVKMMIAWYLATALAKNWDDIIPYIENKSFISWTHNKAIQKSVESFRISDERKAYLKTIKI